MREDELRGQDYMSLYPEINCVRAILTIRKAYLDIKSSQLRTGPSKTDDNVSDGA